MNPKIKALIEENWAYIRSLVKVHEFVDVTSARQSIEESIRFRGPNVYILFFAIMIASLGLNVNSIPVIIGAMLISPLMGPIMGIGLSLGTNDWTMMKSALKNFVVMVTISLFASTLYFLLTPLSMEHPTELLARTTPSIYDVLIALFGGFAGILESSRKKPGNAVAGVAIATALMPPLCTVGYGLSIWNWHYVMGAMYLFSINSIYIALATWVMVKFLHYPSVQQSDNKKSHRIRVLMVVLTVIMIIPSVISAVSMVRDTRFTTKVNQFVAANKTIGKSYIYDYKLDIDEKPVLLHLYVAGEAMADSTKAHFLNKAGLVGLDEEQIVFHDEAVLRPYQFNEETLVKDLMANYNQQIYDKDQIINDLQQQLIQIRNEIIPEKQLSGEIKTLYPSINDIHIAQCPKTEDGRQTIIVLYNTVDRRPLTAQQSRTLTYWLESRLHADEVILSQE